MSPLPTGTNTTVFGTVLLLRVSMDALRSSPLGRAGREVPLEGCAFVLMAASSLFSSSPGFQWLPDGFVRAHVQPDGFSAGVPK